MANKYLRHGETYCGDGTTSAAAASNGGVGAWNNINVFEGTSPAYGTLAAGDVVYIRSKNNAGADITQTMAASINIGMAGLAETNPVTWIIDNGTVWSGISGVLTYTTSGNYSAYVRPYNNIHAASNNNLSFVHTGSYVSQNVFLRFENANSKNIKVDTSANNQYYGMYVAFEGVSTHENITAIVGNRRSGGYGFFAANVSETIATLINPSVTLVTNVAVGKGPVFKVGNYNNGGNIIVYGGKVSGAGATTGVPLVGTDGYSGVFQSFGLIYPATMDFSSAGMFNARYSYITASGQDGKFGNAVMDYFYQCTARFDGYYPTLNATLGDSANTPWSYMLYPYRTSKHNPAKTAISKTYTQSPATKTVGVEFLWANSFATSPTTDTTWVVVTYIDNTTGNLVTMSSYDIAASALSSSSAAWSAATYGPTNFAKYKIELTTPSSIKQDTDITVLFFSKTTSGSASDIIILDPDPVLT